ncbi:MAG: hypothetical protein ACTSV7_00860 [Candidatus Baldrarchaeia archaeon]
MKILDKLKSLPKKIVKGKKEETWVLSPPYDLPSLLSKINNTLKERVAYLEAKNLELEKELKKHRELEKKRKKQDEELEKIVRKIYNQKKNIERKRKENIKILKFDGKMPTFQTADRKTFGKFKKMYGIAIEEHGNGYQFVPILTDLKGKEKRKLQEGVDSIEGIFYDPSNIVSQINSGVVHSSYVITNDDRLSVISRSKKKKKSVDNSKYYEKEIASLNSKIEELNSELSRALERERQYIEHINELKQANKLEKITSDYRGALLSAALEKLENMMGTHGNLLLASQDAHLNRILTQKVNQTLVDKIEELRTKMGEIYSQTPRELIREEIKRDFEEIASTAKTQLGKEKIVEKETKVSEKPVRGAKK